MLSWNSLRLLVNFKLSLFILLQFQTFNYCLCFFFLLDVFDGIKCVTLLCIMMNMYYCCLAYWNRTLNRYFGFVWLELIIEFNGDTLTV